MARNPDDLGAWRVLAELYFEDGLYPQCLWILGNPLKAAADAQAKYMRRLSQEHSALLDIRPWPDQEREWEHRPLPGIPETYDLWQKRAAYLEFLRARPFAERLWLGLAELYYEEREMLMGLWCSLTVLVNTRSQGFRTLQQIPNGFILATWLSEGAPHSRWESTLLGFLGLRADGLSEVNTTNVPSEEAWRPLAGKIIAQAIGLSAAPDSLSPADRCREVGDRVEQRTGIRPNRGPTDLAQCITPPAADWRELAYLA